MNALICRAEVGFCELGAGGETSQCRLMTNLTELPSTPSDRLVPFTDQLRLAVAGYLARFKGSSRQHTESDLPWLPVVVANAPGGDVRCHVAATTGCQRT
jgi:hypothetical protein